MINIILAKEQSLIKSDIKKLLETEADICITGEVGSVKEIADHLDNGNKYDIILTELRLADVNGPELLEKIKKKDPESQIIVLTEIDNEFIVSKVLRAGVNGYLLKDVGPKELIYAIRHVCNGGRYISSSLSNIFLNKSLQPIDQASNPVADLLKLTSREKEILELLSEGYTDKEMSEKLFLSPRTVEGHRQSLINKTYSANTASLIWYAVKHRLIT